MQFSRLISVVFLAFYCYFSAVFESFLPFFVFSSFSPRFSFFIISAESSFSFLTVYFHVFPFLFSLRLFPLFTVFSAISVFPLFPFLLLSLPQGPGWVSTHSSKALILLVLVNTEFHCRVGVGFIVYCVSFGIFIQLKRSCKQLRTGPTGWILGTDH